MLSVIIYLLVTVFTLVYFVFFTIVFLLTALFDRNKVVLHALSRLWARCYFVIIPGWRVSIEGQENIDKDKPYVIVVNHSSMVDILLLYSIPLNFKWVSKREVYKFPVYGWVLWMHGDIAIERGTASSIRKLVREGKRWLDRGVSVMIFPEGSRSKTGRVGRFKEGGFMMAKSAEVGVLPCVTTGTDTAMKGWRFNFSNRFRIKVLPPVDAQRVKDSDIQTLTRDMQQLISDERENMIAR